MIIHVVEIGFGYGPFDADPIWTDVSEWVELTDEPILAELGGSGVTPGSVSFTVDNSDGRFDPRNTAGPYFGQLLPGVPLRVRVAGMSVEDGEIWRGVVASGWARQLTDALPSVVVVGADVVGAIAQSDAPSSAWEALAGRFGVAAPIEVSPDEWWQPAAGNTWIDNLTGQSGRHTSLLASSSSLVDGGAETWSSERDGHGVAPPAAWTPIDSGMTVVSCWVKLTDGESHQLVEMRDGVELGMAVLRLSIDPGDIVRLRVTGSAWWQAEWAGALVETDSGPEAPRLKLTDGKAHHLLVAAEAVPPGTPGGVLVGQPDAKLWVDGRYAGRLNNVSTLRIRPSGAPAPGQTQFGPYAGVVDHVMVWREAAVSWSELDQWAAAMWDAGWLAWAGDFLDDRVRRIVGAVGAASMIGGLEPSSIQTLQGYRSSRVQDLLQTIVDTEQGRIWVDRHGQLRFSARGWAERSSRSMTAQATFSDIGSELDAGGAVEMVDAGTVIDDDPLDVVTVAKVTSTHGRMQLVEADAGALDSLGRRQSVHLSGLLHRSDRESRAIAEWIVMSQSAPRPKVRSLTWEANLSAEAALLARTVEQGDRLLVRKSSPSGTVEVLGHVTSVRHRISATSWTVAVSLDSTHIGWEWFVLDDSVLDGSHVLSF